MALARRLGEAALGALSAGAPRWRAWLARAAGASLAAFLAAETYKSWPLSYHVRLFALLLRCYLFPRLLVGLDVPLVSRGRVCLSDLDYHGHVNNAQYALDADLMARYPWISAVLMNTGTPAGTGSPYRANAFIGSAVFFFLREMRWRADYRIETKCVGIDEKWIYLESRWYLEGGKSAAARPDGAGAAQGAASGAGAVPATAALSLPAPRVRAEALVRSGGALAAVQLTRFVMKESSGPSRGKTIPPAVAFAELGLAVPESFSRAVRVGQFFTEAFEIAVATDSGRKQSLAGDCGC